MDEVRGHRQVRVADDVRLPLTDVLCAGGPVAALGLGVAAWVFYRWNPTLSISFRPLGGTPVVTLLVATLLTIAAIPLGVYLARRFEFQGSFARFGGAAIAGVSVMVFAAFGANTMLAVNSNYQRVQSAEDLALAIAAWRIQTGSSESQPIKVPAITQTLAGNVVARMLDRGASARKGSQAFEIYWDQRQSKNNRLQMVRQTLGTVYVGQLEQQPDGKMAVKTSSETIEVNASPAQLSRVKGDETVLAIVPVDAQEASRVLPVAELGDHAAALTAEQR